MGFGVDSMPANLTAEAKAKWNEATAAKRPEQKIKALREFLSLAPKHKGTERLRAQVKRKLAELRQEVELSKRKRGGSGPRMFIPKEGAGQIVVLGLTNVGRSSLLTAVTNAKPEVTPHEYTTTTPIPGMLGFEDIQFQLVEAPALRKGSSEGSGEGLLVLGLARNADGLILMADLSNDPCDQFTLIVDELEKAGVTVWKPSGSVEVLRGKSSLGVQVIILGELVGCDVEDVRKMLEGYGARNTLIRVYGKVSIEDVEDAFLEASMLHRPSVVVANKLDVESSKEELDELMKIIDGRLPVLPASCKLKEGLTELGSTLFRTLGIIRVYTKEPSQASASSQPIVMGKGSKVGDVARQIHRELYRNFKYARIWGSSKFPGEKVGVNHVLQDRDVVEIHTK